MRNLIFLFIASLFFSQAHAIVLELEPAKVVCAAKVSSSGYDYLSVTYENDLLYAFSDSELNVSSYKRHCLNMVALATTKSLKVVLDTLQGAYSGTKWLSAGGLVCK